MSDVAQLYQALIREHDHAPRACGPLPGATHEATIDNPLCGDVCTLHLTLAGDRVTAATFEGRGCALSRAAASMMTSRLPGLDRAALRTLAADFDAFVRAAPDSATPAALADALGDLTAFAGVRAFRSRQPCATLPFRALLAAIDAGAP
jgi:nitrogen fixation protein NifU and related proteins